VSSEPSTITVSRRQLVRTGASLAAAFAGVGAWSTQSANQFDTTPPATLEPEPISSPPPDPIAGLAARLNYDQGAMFAFVRDEIHYESYAGVLRGATGTLMARAGNSTDQATLLAALFDAAQIPYRFAIGALDGSSTDYLVSRLNISRDQAQTAFDMRMVAAYSQDPTLAFLSTPASEATPPPDALQALDEAAEAAEHNRARATAWLETTSSMIAGALDEVGITIPDVAPSLPAMEIERHTWVQAPDGSAWIDFNPTFPEPGQASGRVEAVETPGALPDEMFHTVRFRVVVEEVRGNSLQRRDAVSRAFTSDQLINLPVSFMLAPTDALAELGQSISGALGGGYRFNPAIVFGEDAEIATTPVVFQSGQEGVLSAPDDPGGAPAHGETAGVWYAVDVTSPGQEPVTVERTWLDRFDPDDRLQPEIDLSRIKPLEIVTLPDGSTAVAGLDRLTMLTVDVARLPLPMALGDPALNDTMSMINAVGPCWSALRETMSIQFEWPIDMMSWIATPQVTAVTFRPENPLVPDSPLVMETDLLLHAPATARFAGASERSNELPPAVTAGIVDSLAERLLLDPALWAADTASQAPVVPLANVGAVFEQAATDGVPLLVLISPDDLQGMDVDARSAAAIVKVLEAGQVVIAPERAVDLDGAPRLGWWVIDPATGATRDQMDTGGGSASGRLPISTPFFAPASVDYVINLARRLWGRYGSFKCLGGIVVSAIGYWAILQMDPGGEAVGKLFVWAYGSHYGLTAACK